MLKVFKVAKHNAVLWAKKLSETELLNVIHHKYEEKPQRERKEIKETKGKINREHVNRRELEQEEQCPICQDEMTEEDLHLHLLTFCSTCCKNLHAKCMQVWARNQVASGETINCPVCAFCIYDSI